MEGPDNFKHYYLRNFTWKQDETMHKVERTQLHYPSVEMGIGSQILVPNTYDVYWFENKAN